MSNSKKNGRRGFTIAELVVALAIIVIVSATAVAIVNSQNTIYLRTVQTTEATNMAENAVECFRFAVENPNNTFIENGSEVKTDSISSAFYYMYSKTGCLEEYTEAQDSYEIKTNGMTVTITIEGDTLTFLAKDGEKEILKESYTYTR